MIIKYEKSLVGELSGSKPIILMFYAEWCHPCTSFHPVVEKVSLLIPELDIYKIDVDSFSSIADRFRINSVPTLVFLKPGNDPELSIGVLKELVLEAKIRQFFSR